MSTIITPSEEQINIVVNDEKISINVESGDVIVNVNEQIVEVSTVNGGYPLPTTVYSVFGRTGNIIAVDGDYDLGELGDVTLVSTTNGDVLTYDGTKWVNKAVSGTGTVTSVDMSVPVGLQVSGNPISTVGTIALNYAAGYSMPTTAKQTTWDTAYNDSIVSASVSGTTTKTLTLNQQDGGTITASWTDIDTNLVTSVNGYVGTVVLTTSDIAEGSRLYYTETRVSNNVDVAANTAARHSAVTIGTANGLSLASQVLSLALASASTTGALSSTDWNKFNDASGTVTSVGASVPTGMTISGSPIVSAGTLAFGLDTGYTIPLSTQLVPSGGSEGQLLAKYSATNYDTIWIDNYTEQLRDTVKAAVAINKGQAVYVSDANGTNQIVSLASNASEGTSSKTLGLASQNFAINDIGQIITEGLLSGINTSNSYAGDPVWLGVSGNLIFGLANKPVAPAHLVYIGVVTRAQLNNGEIYVKIQNGFELQELHNVLISSVANNEGLFYETSTSLWKNKSIATVLGYTPISLTSLSGVSPLSYNNTTGAFSIAQATTSANGYLSSTDWNTFNGKQAALNGTGFVKATGTTISYDNSTYYLASNPSAYIALTGLSATAPLSYNNTTGGFTISQAGVSGNGYLSSTDWNTFNNKQTSGNYITALSGEATASGPGSAAVTLSTSAVTGKLLTGVNITGGSISATDSILVAFGKVQNQINGVLGGAIYQSVWNASTNSPTLTSGTGTKGYYYIVSVAGSTNLDGITDWKIGDWAIFNGTTWNKVDNSDAVSSVNGFTGAVSLTTANISEVTNLYYTDVRVSANSDVAANTAARHAAVTLGTANGLSLSTQALSLGLASTSATGALSSTDWNTFNLKQAALSGTGFVKISGTTISYDNSTYALDSDVVKLTGNQTIGSTKTFSLATKNNSGILLSDTSSTSAPSGYISLAGYNYTTSRGLLINLASQSYLFLFNTAAGNNYTFPNATGTLALTSDLTGGTVTSVSALTIGTSGTDLSSSVANSTTTPVITLNVPTASATNRGALSSADWTTFNNKQGTITLTTTGTSGAATLVANTLNIPNYAPDLSGYVTLATTQTITGAKTFSAALNGTSAIFSSSVAAKSSIAVSNNGGEAPILSATSTFADGYRATLRLSNTHTGGKQWDVYSTNNSDGGYGGGKLAFVNVTDSVNALIFASTGSATFISSVISGGKFEASFSNTNTTFDNSSYLRLVNTGTSTLNQRVDLIMRWADGTYNGTGGISMVRESATARSGKLILQPIASDGNNIEALSLSSTGAATFTATDASGNRTNPFNTLTIITTNPSAPYEKFGGSILFKNSSYVTGIVNTSRIRSVIYDGGGSEGGGLTFETTPTAGGTLTPTMTLYYNGNVGIGNELPTYKLDVNGTGRFNNADGSDLIRYSATGVNTNYATKIVSGANDVLVFRRQHITAGALDIMALGYNGNAGIGTSIPATKLHIGTTTDAENTLTIQSSTTGVNKIFFSDSNSGAGLYAGFIEYQHTSNLLIFGVNSAQRMSIDSGGAIICTSSVTATSFFESSDSRLKTLIQDNYQTKGIASITPKLYTKNGKVELGYYAQDFVGILDSAVSKSSDDMLSLSYREVLVAKVYALEQEIKDLKAKMN